MIDNASRYLSLAAPLAVGWRKSDVTNRGSLCGSRDPS